MTYIGLDVSLNSTALYYKALDQEFFINFLKKQSKLDSRQKDLEDLKIMSFVSLDYPKTKNYSDNEILKIKNYVRNSDLICSKIQELTSLIDGPVNIAIEGYSYSSKQSMIAELAPFTTFIRKFCIDLCEKTGGKFYVYSPATIKKTAAELTYEKDSKGVCRNEKGIAGGKFNKGDMLRAYLKTTHSENSKLREWIEDHIEILELKNVPKPIDDELDAWWCCQKLVGDCSGL